MLKSTGCQKKANTEKQAMERGFYELCMTDSKCYIYRENSHQSCKCKPMLQAGGEETHHQGDHQWQNSAASSAFDTQLET